jgi:hypothetical protein
MDRFVAIRGRLQFLPPEFAPAMRAMDYKQALTCQMEIDDLERELS